MDDALAGRRQVSAESPLLERADDNARAEHCPPKLLAVGLLVILVVGLSFGLSYPSDLEGKGSGPIRTLSSVIGWTYFGAWSVSFYPQVLSRSDDSRGPDL